jgi:hypothetical protein
MLLIGSRHRQDSCSEAYRFARSGNVPVDPKIDLDVSGLLSWGSSIAPPSTQPSLRRHPPGPSPRLRIGTTTSRSCSALAVPPGFSGFLRSEQIRRPARSTVCRFVAPRSRPWGSPSFGPPGSASQPSRRPEDRWTRRSMESRPLWRGPFEAFPSSAAVDHAVTAPRPFGRGRVHRLAFPLAVRAALACVSPRRAVPLSTSGLSSTEESVAFVRRCRRATARCSLGLWIDSFPTLPRASRRPAVAGRFAWRPEPLRRPPTRTWGEGRVFRPCLAPCDRWCDPPEGRSRSIAVAPVPPEGGTSAALHNGPRSGMPVDPPREEVPPRRSDARRRSVADVIATHLRRDSCATQRSLRRAAAGGSSSFSPSFRGCPRT